MFGVTFRKKLLIMMSFIFILVSKSYRVTVGGCVITLSEIRIHFVANNCSITISLINGNSSNSFNLFSIVITT